MVLGRQKERQGELMVGWAELPRSPGHAFYDRLRAILVEAGFDGFAESACAPYYGDRQLDGWAGGVLRWIVGSRGYAATLPPVTSAQVVKAWARAARYWTAVTWSRRR